MRVIVLVLVTVGCGRIGFGVGPQPDGGPDDAETPCAWTELSAPVRLPSPVQSPFDEWSGATFLDETRLMFHRYETGNGDLFVASRASASANFEVVQPVGELNTSSNQWTPTLSEDGLVLVYADNEAGAARVPVIAWTTT